MIDKRPQADRLLVAELWGEARHRARWRDLSSGEEAEAVSALTDLAAGRADLLAEVAGVLEGASAGEPLARQAAGAVPQGGGRSGGDPGLGRGRPALGRGEPITPGAVVQAAACLTMATQLARHERPGWSLIAADVWGLPWRGVRSRPVSHGTWTRHDACGAVAAMRAGAADCPACGPQPGSRTHRARQDEPYLLYQVTCNGLTKFGVGTEERVRPTSGPAPRSCRCCVPPSQRWSWPNPALTCQDRLNVRSGSTAGPAPVRRALGASERAEATAAIGYGGHLPDAR
ncbi:MAG: hypothetical protein ACRDRJ_23185 [Streptosporangiaceae bacterium]